MNYQPYHCEAYPEFDPVNIRTVPQEILRRFSGSSIFKLNDDFEFYIDGEYFKMPEGFYSDLNSDPGIIQLFLDKDNFHNIAAGGIHDYGYRSKCFGSRKRTDKVYKTVLEYYGSDESRIRYLGVRLGGWLAWRKHRKREKAKK